MIFLGATSRATVYKIIAPCSFENLITFHNFTIKVSKQRVPERLCHHNPTQNVPRYACIASEREICQNLTKRGNIRRFLFS